MLKTSLAFGVPHCIFSNSVILLVNLGQTLFTIDTTGGVVRNLHNTKQCSGEFSHRAEECREM